MSAIAALSRRRPPVRALAAVAAALGLAFAAPLVSAHVNRTVGPYTILVILVEEPTFQDNHAGFQFWVHRGDTPVTGLEQTVQASAVGHETSDQLVVPPLDASGWYVLDDTSAGAAFDPLGGGPWLLRLTGAIDGTPLDEPFAVTFPGYPRVGGANPAPASSAAPASTADSLPWPAVVVAAVAVAAVAGVWLGLRRRRTRAAILGPDATARDPHRGAVPGP